MIAQAAEIFTQKQVGIQFENPGFAATTENYQAYGLFRSQWGGLTNRSIFTQTAGFAAPLPNLNAGFSINIINDAIGLSRYSAISMGYSQLLLNSTNLKLGLGVDAGLGQHRWKGQLATTPDGEYAQNINHNDLLLSNQQEESIAFQAAAGLWISYKNLSMGSSLRNIPSAVSNQGLFSTSELFLQRRKLLSHLSYQFELNQVLKLNSYLVLNTEFKHYQLTLLTILSINDNIITGIAFRGYNNRNFESFSIVFGFNIYKQLKLSYSYDIGLGSLSAFQSGSHEFGLIWKKPLAQKTSKAAIIFNPRFL